MRYLYIKRLNKKQIIELINNNDPSKVIEGLTTACMKGNDFKFATEICEKLSNSPNKYVQRSVLNCLVLIALNFGKIDDIVANKIITNGILSNEGDIREAAYDVIDDLEHNVRGYKYTKIL